MASTDDIKSRLKKYGVLIAYSVAGMAGLGLFSFKMIITRLENMQKIKTKSKVPILHQNMKRLGTFGIIGVMIYTYGLWQIIKRVPQTNSHQQMGDYTLLSSTNRKNPQMQDHYIIKTMKLFGVSERMIEKTKQQFKKINQQETPQQNPSLNKELFLALFQRRKLQKNFQAQSTNKNKNQDIKHTGNEKK